MVIKLPTGDNLQVTASLGVASFSDDLDYELLLQRVDQALYMAKQKGRNRVEIAHRSTVLVAAEKTSGSWLQA